MHQIVSISFVKSYNLFVVYFYEFKILLIYVIFCHLERFKDKISKQDLTDFYVLLSL